MKGARIMAKVIKIQNATMIWGRLIEPTNHPQFPDSAKKFSATFLFEKDQLPSVKKAFLALIAERLQQLGKFDGLTEEEREKKVLANYETLLDSGGQSPLSKQAKTYTAKDGTVTPNPDAGKWAIKGKNPQRPTLFQASPTGYVIFAEDDPAKIDSLFYDGGIYHVILEIYYSKAGNIASSLRAIYWAGEGTRRGVSGYSASADDFEMPEGTFATASMGSLPDDDEIPF
jgi:hypothetical protein